MTGVRHALSVLGAVTARVTGRVERIDATLLAPATPAGATSGSGPVDAVRWSPVERAVLPGDDRCPVRIRVLVVPQTRCWLLTATLSGGAPLDLAMDAGPRVLPPPVGGDTARAAEYLLDLGGTRHWPDAVLLGAPERDGHDLRLVLAFTDAYRADLPSPLDPTGPAGGHPCE